MIVEKLLNFSMSSRIEDANVHCFDYLCSYVHMYPSLDRRAAIRLPFIWLRSLNTILFELRA